MNSGQISLKKNSQTILKNKKVFQVFVLRYFHFKDVHIYIVISLKNVEQQTFFSY